MKGNSEVIGHLNALLKGELTAMDQYFIHSRMYEDWGLKELYKRLDHEMEDEKGHADRLIKRILFLEGRPDLSSREPLKIGGEVEEMLRNDLALELKVVAHLKEVVAFCESVSDYVTRDMLVEMLEDTEHDHTHWLEKQLGLIERIGLANYQQSKAEL